MGGLSRVLRLRSLDEIGQGEDSASNRRSSSRFENFRVGPLSGYWLFTKTVSMSCRGLGGGGLLEPILCIFLVELEHRTFK